MSRSVRWSEWEHEAERLSISDGVSGYGSWKAGILAVIN